MRTPVPPLSASGGPRMFRPRWRERLLEALSSRARHRNTHEGVGAHGLDAELDDLRRDFPDLNARVSGRRVLDFGCGYGHQALALARLGAATVVGADIDDRRTNAARRLAAAHGLADRATFVSALDASQLGTFDVVLSLNSFEHVADPDAVLALMRSALAPGGEIILSFGPPWLAPFGAHMYAFTRVPWVHLLFDEATVLRVRSHYVDDGATRYEDVRGGLNRMTLARLAAIVAGAGLRVAHRRDTFVRPQGLFRLLTRWLPRLRELFTNQVNVVLKAVDTPA